MKEMKEMKEMRENEMRKNELMEKKNKRKKEFAELMAILAQADRKVSEEIEKVEADQLRQKHGVTGSGPISPDKEGGGERWSMRKEAVKRALKEGDLVERVAQFLPNAVGAVRKGTDIEMISKANWQKQEQKQEQKQKQKEERLEERLEDLATRYLNNRDYAIKEFWPSFEPDVDRFCEQYKEEKKSADLESLKEYLKDKIQKVTIPFLREYRFCELDDLCILRVDVANLIDESAKKTIKSMEQEKEFVEKVSPKVTQVMGEINAASSSAEKTRKQMELKAFLYLEYLTPRDGGCGTYLVGNKRFSLKGDLWTSLQTKIVFEKGKFETQELKVSDVLNAPSPFAEKLLCTMDDQQEKGLSEIVGLSSEKGMLEKLMEIIKGLFRQSDSLFKGVDHLKEIKKKTKEKKKTEEKYGDRGL